MIVPYVVFQSIGALAAGLVLRVVFRPNASSHYLGSTMLSVNTALGFALETIGTFTLAFVILRVSTGEKDLKFQALTVGLTLFALILTLGAFTGASFNPARSIGPAVVSGHLDDLWLFITAPLTGGAFAAIVERTRSRG